MLSAAGECVLFHVFLGLVTMLWSTRLAYGVVLRFRATQPRDCLFREENLLASQRTRQSSRENIEICHTTTTHLIN
jgi:hypothetical protein